MPEDTGSPSTLALPARAIAAQRSAARASWMSPAAASAKSLLYVSDAGTFEVYAYAFPSLALMGTLTGFNRPQGECSDRAGNVWITNTNSLNLLEYAHGGTNAIADLADPTGYPVGCAVNPATGDLAVTNLFDLSGGGEVLVYKNARGTPRPYGNPALHYCYFDAYDDKGNLYVSGSSNGGAYLLTLLKPGGTALSHVALTGGTIYFPGGVAWDGSSLVLGDQKCGNRDASCLYRASVSGATAHITGVTALKNACDVAQASIAGKQVAGGDYEYCGTRHSSVDLWPYPAGGTPDKRITRTQTPVGTTISEKP
jgi:DNA-binding beta-propeller fold protein YncE